MWLEKEEILKYRPQSKEPYEFYNCGGHALGIKKWYQLGPDVHWFNKGLSRCSKNGGWREFERSCVKQLLKDCPELEPIGNDAINNVSVNLDEYEIIAFRISRQFFGSYHFMRCERNGDWTEKHGSGHYISRHRYEEIYDVWEKYDGRLFFFIRERNERHGAWQITTTRTD